MATQPTSDTPFGLEPNIAAGLAYLLGVIGGVIMLAGGGTNRFVKWAACQSITMFIVYIALWIVVRILFMTVILALVALPLFFVIQIAFFVAWIWTWITAFQGRDVRVPLVADLTDRIFASQLTTV
ncbi:MAG TPA: hypothetical protein VFN49_06090 [Candidatus Aquilonibacter sp.]|nr:hypothetical protein [Candidatus Aquilonibacter sp.]